MLLGHDRLLSVDGQALLATLGGKDRDGDRP
jgi:hypothetical protein